MAARRGLFVITGPPGSGKTPIVRELRSLGFAGVPEPAREVIAEQRATGGDGIYDRNPRRFVDLMLARAIADFQRLTGEVRPVFFDRAIPDLIGYAELFGLDPSEAVLAAARHRYDGPVIALPSWPEIYVTDDERRMTVAEAAAFGDRIRDIYVDLGYPVVEVPRDTIAARTQFVLETLGLAEDRTAAGTSR
jgi:predicted ATPase